MPSNYTKWMKNYNLVKNYVDSGYSIDYLDKRIINPDTVQWLCRQRKIYKNDNHSAFTNRSIVLLNQLFFDWNPNDTLLLNSEITFENKDIYNNTLNDRVNHVIEDLVYEGIDEISDTNQDEIEKIMIKRIWR